MSGSRALVLAALVLLAAGCGGQTASTSAAGPSPDPRAAYTDCLRKNGVTVPTFGPRPTDRPTGGPSDRPTGGPADRPTDRPFAQRTMSPEMQKAMQACASLRPTNGAFFGQRDNTAFQAFQGCMKDHGVTVQGALRDTETADPKTAAALKICRPLLPTPTPSS